MASEKYIVVRQDTLEGRQDDGTWGPRSTATEYIDHDAALEAAARSEDEIGRMCSVQESIRDLVS